jgi:hypothetical protein
MPDVALFLEAPDQPLGTEVATLLQQHDIDVHLSVVDHFPIADPLALRFAGMRDRFAVVAILISALTQQSTWMLREMLMQRTALKTSGGGGTFVAIFAPGITLPSWIDGHTDAFTSASSSETILRYLLDQLTLARG